MLNVQKGNMYGFVTHTWNVIKGKCIHDCGYCYMKRFPQKALHFDNKELKTDLGNNNFIFVGSSTDMFADNVPSDWIIQVLDYCRMFDNKYLFQTKNPKRFKDFVNIFPEGSVLCITLECNAVDTRSPGAPSTYERKVQFENLDWNNDSKMITLEPVMNFSLDVMVKWIKDINPFQVNIGADSGNNNLEEPSKEKVDNLIKELEKFTIVFKKDNLKRIK